MVHGSTFSGIGSPEIAASMLGWENAFHCEINPFGRQILDYYFPNAESYEDITTTDFSKWGGQIDVLTGGFPCQPFSYAGWRRGTKDDRYLWPYMLKCIQQIRPTWFVGENVAGITTMVFPGEDVEVGSGSTLFDETHFVRRDERYVVEEICENLERIGYSVQPLIIPACAVGAPHRRDRVFFVARRQDSSSDTSNSKRNGLRGSGREQRGVCREERKALYPEKYRLDLQSYVEHAGTTRSVADTDSRGLEGRCNVSEYSDKRNNGQPSPNTCKDDLGIGERFGYLLPENRWRTFPTVSPVYRGNDGISFNVDCLSIPFGQWKKESLKAYGNSIVVQVMYEIFSLIEEVEDGV